MKSKKIGKYPSGERLKKIQQSPNYKDGVFQNLKPTEVILKNASFIRMMKDYFNKPKTVRPPYTIPSVKIDLKTIVADKPTIVWFGHSSYFIKSKNITLLVDPVFSGRASPVPFFGKAFKGTDVYDTNDFPFIDVIIITHDHYDHLDYETIVQFTRKCGIFIIPSGVGEHLEYWGIEKTKIIELDWCEEKKIDEGVKITATPARHFSGRSLKRNKTLWTSYVLELHDYMIFIGGDSGYDEQFKLIGEKYGPFDLAILEGGQYGAYWPYIHMLPEETVTAAMELKASVLLPVHWGKFTLAYHEWDEPVKRVLKEAENKKLQIATPRIGEPFTPGGAIPQNDWWNAIKK